MKKIFSIIALPILFFSIISPANAAINIWQGTGSGGVTCNQSAVNSEGMMTNACDFCDALVVAKNIINYLTQLAFVLVTAMIVWGAIQMIISAGSSEKFTHGKKGITDAVIGLLVIMATWLIINEFLHLLNGNLTLPWDNIQC
ncbi:MAG: hypothetical protein Q8L36_01060 [bacterium]|nr:hypothetical protein [bacterium]